MSSEQRSNSAVRNLRSIFENKNSESPGARGRSPGSLGDLDTHRPRSKIRASFIAVEPTMAALAAEQDASDTSLKRESSAGQRRASFSDGQDGEALDAARETVHAEQERRENESSVAETIPENAIETPAIESNKTLGNSPAQTTDKQAGNPDKPVTGAEEEPAEMTTADPADEAAVSGGQGLPPVAEDLRQSTRGSASRFKPNAISTRAPPKSSSSVKSPTSQPKTPVSAGTSQKIPAKKPSRSSLTAPTAASVARSAAADRTTTSKLPSPNSKPKPREVTKPLEVSSRLTAPTASMRARMESSSSAATNAKPVANVSRPKPTTSARPTPRTSLARPDSRSSQNASKKPAALVDGSFLERMMRPTAASTNKIQEKVEPTAPLKKQLPLRPKPNGQPKGSTKSRPPVTTTADSASELIVQEEDATQVDISEDAAGLDEAAGNETPLQANGHQEDAPTLESTPAALGEEEVIR